MAPVKYEMLNYKRRLGLYSTSRMLNSTFPSLSVKIFREILE